MCAKRKLISKVTALHKLPTQKRLEIGKELFPVNQQIVTTIYGEKDVEHLAGLKATWCWLKDFRTEEGKLVGYHIMYLFEMEYRGKKILIWEGNAGFLREYRGKDSVSGFGFLLAVWSRFRYPFRKIYNMFTTLQPASLIVVEKFFPSAYPYPNRSISSEKKAMLMDLAEQMGLERIPGKHEMVRMSPRAVNMTSQERAYWERSSKPAARFFLEICPDYKDHEKLLTFVDFTFGKLGVATFRVIKSQSRRITRPLAASIRKLKEKVVPTGTAQKVNWLRKISLLSNLPERALRQLAERSAIREISSGEMLLRQGEKGDGMYLIVRGSLYILLENKGVRYPIDEMTTGDYLGEMSVLSNQPRTASAMAFSPLKLIWIPRAALLELMRENPELNERLWRTYAQRAGDNLLRFHPDYEQLSWEDRSQLLQSASLVEIKETRSLQPASSLTLLMIAGRSEKAGAQITAPHLICLKQGEKLLLHKGAKYLQLE